MKLVRYAKTGSILSGIAFIVFGLLLVLFPTISLLTICYAIGAIVLISGIVRIVGYFSKDLYALAFQFDLALGTFNILLGILLLLHPTWIAAAFPLMLGLYVLINSLFSIQTSMDSRRFGMEYWWVLLILSVLAAGFGLALTLHPFAGAKAMTILYGAALAFCGVGKLVFAIYTIVIQKRKTPDYIEITDYREKEDAN